jgi:hypothetical protein
MIQGKGRNAVAMASVIRAEERVCAMMAGARLEPTSLRSKVCANRNCVPIAVAGMARATRMSEHASVSLGFLATTAVLAPNFATGRK